MQFLELVSSISLLIRTTLTKLDIRFEFSTFIYPFLANFCFLSFQELRAAIQSEMMGIAFHILKGLHLYGNPIFNLSYTAKTPHLC